MKLVLDTDVVVAAFLSTTGASNQLLSFVYERRVLALASIGLVLEYEMVLKRPQHLSATGLTTQEIDAFIKAFLRYAIPVENYYTWRPLLKDPNDEFVLETAINGRADAIITFNRKDYGTAPHRFGVQVLRPGDALRMIRL